MSDIELEHVPLDIIEDHNSEMARAPAPDPNMPLAGQFKALCGVVFFLVVVFLVYAGMAFGTYKVIKQQPHICEEGKWSNVIRATDTDTSPLVLYIPGASELECTVTEPPPGNYTANQPIFAWRCAADVCRLDGPGQLGTSASWIINLLVMVLLDSLLVGLAVILLVNGTRSNN
jgi:hypothetical protein